MAVSRRKIPTGHTDPAVSQAATVYARLQLAQVADDRTQTLQHVPAPICRADLVNPQPFMKAQALLPWRPPTGNKPVTIPPK